MAVHLAREKDVERLRQAALLLEAENARLVRRNVELTRALLQAQGVDASHLQLRLAELERQLGNARAALFAPSSEKRPTATPEDGHAPEEIRRGHGPRAQQDLPLEEVMHALDEADTQCPSCGGLLTPMTGCFEESEEVDVLERRFVLKRHRRQKYRCACNACVETA
ncbi:IS66 family transposase zinc-finger binding domain-containing protein, partial [Myxococcus sp. QH3KD-4-1]|nr:IS66 family transposase zinc-finger binding domain-containing protein [Myxococcus qinghaiensis]